MYENKIFFSLIQGLLSRNKKKDESRFVLVLIDIAALVAQGTSFVLWPLLDSSRFSLWLIPPSLFLVSCGWWENYVSTQSPIGKYHEIDAKSLKKLWNEKNILNERKISNGKIIKLLIKILVKIFLTISR